MEKENSLLEKFCEEIKYNNRFFVNDEIANLFNVIIKEFTRVIPKNTILYRGRINPYNDVTPYTDKEIGKPDHRLILKNGRLNPYGISYMYMSGDINTVIAELKPNYMSIVSVGKFLLKEDKRVVVLPNKVECNKIYGLPLNISLAKFMILLSSRFSKTIDYNNQDIEYIPTQFFAAFCKNNNLQGIKHLSGVMNNNEEEHYNYIFFEDDKIEYLNTKVYYINDIKYDICEID